MPGVEGEKGASPRFLFSAQGLVGFRCQQVGEAEKTKRTSGWKAVGPGSLPAESRGHGCVPDGHCDN